MGCFSAWFGVQGARPAQCRSVLLLILLNHARLARVFFSLCFRLVGSVSAVRAAQSVVIVVAYARVFFRTLVDITKKDGVRSPWEGFHVGYTPFTPRRRRGQAEALVGGEQGRSAKTWQR